MNQAGLKTLVKVQRFFGYGHDSRSNFNSKMIQFVTIFTAALCQSSLLLLLYLYFTLYLYIESNHTSSQFLFF